MSPARQASRHCEAPGRTHQVPSTVHGRTCPEGQAALQVRPAPPRHEVPWSAAALIPCHHRSQVQMRMLRRDPVAGNEGPPHAAGGARAVHHARLPTHMHVPGDPVHTTFTSLHAGDVSLQLHRVAHGGVGSCTGTCTPQGILRSGCAAVRGGHRRR